MPTRTRSCATLGASTPASLDRARLHAGARYNWRVTISDAIQSIYQSKTIYCTEQQYRCEIRDALRLQAGRWREEGQTVRAKVALMEVERLDRMFSVPS